MQRRSFLITAAAAALLPQIAYARPFLWQVYGGDPLAQDYAEAIQRLPEVLDLMVGAGKITRAQADKLLYIRANQASYAGKIRNGDRFDAMAYHTGRPIIRTDVQAAFGEGFVADTAEWHLDEGETRIYLILPVRGEGPGGRRVEKCYNWAIRIGAAVCDPFTFYVQFRGVNTPVKLTWNFWRPLMTAKELLADPCVCVLDAKMQGCAKPIASCSPCIPGWTYGGRGTPSVILTTVMTGSGYLRVPKSFLNPNPVGGTALLICSYETQFRSPATRDGYGKEADPAYFNRFWGHGGNASIDPFLFAV